MLTQIQLTRNSRMVARQTANFTAEDVMMPPSTAPSCQEVVLIKADRD
jgi:hypothetical protein